MSRTPVDDATRYARAIERRWARLWERPVVLSPRDWSRIARWHALGIPLEIVWDAMQDEVERLAGRAAAPRLASLAPRIEEAWSVVLDGRRGRETGAADAPVVAAVDRWRRAAGREPAGSALRGLLDELLERLPRAADTDELDRELDRRLAGAVDPRLADEARVEATRKLEPFARRMSRERFEATRERACADALRRRLDLPRLAQRSSET